MPEIPENKPEYEGTPQFIFAEEPAPEIEQTEAQIRASLERAAEGGSLIYLVLNDGGEGLVTPVNYDGPDYFWLEDGNGRGFQVKITNIKMAQLQ